MKITDVKFRMHPIAFGVFVTCISVIFLLMSGSIVAAAGIQDEYASLAREVVFLVFSGAFIKSLGLLDSCLHFKAEGFLKGLKIGALFLIMILPSALPIFLISSKDMLSPGTVRILSTVIFT